MTQVEMVDPPEEDGHDIWKMRLYVRGQTPKSITAMINLTRMCEVHLAGRYEIDVVDLEKDPSLARNDDILAVPTLVRYLPAPMRKVVGDLSDTESVLIGLRVKSELT